MFYEQRLDVPETPADLFEEYRRALERAVAAVGVADAAETTGIDRGRLDELVAGDSPPLTLEEAAKIQSLVDDAPDAETIEVMACEHLLLGMTTAVLDVDAVARRLDLDLDPTEIQQKIERRAPMSFEEFVCVQHVIADAAP